MNVESFIGISSCVKFLSCCVELYRATVEHPSDFAGEPKKEPVFRNHFEFKRKCSGGLKNFFT